MSNTKKAILVVSFGTSHADTREKTIDRIEKAVQEAFPDRQLYRAWTSGMIRRKLQKTCGIEIDSVSEAMERMQRDGVTDVLVQPTHILNGVENDLMKEDILAAAGNFEAVRTGTPLLSEDADLAEAVRAVAAEFSDLADDEALILMGHGTDHHANAVYAALDYRFHDLGYENIFVGTVEAYPMLENAVRRKRALPRLKRVVLAPFMIVAGDHAQNDMAGEEEDSWQNILQRQGYPTRCVIRGLGEYPQMIALLVDHAKKAEKETPQ